MAQLTALGVRHLRSLYQIEPAVELRPITILLGRNSIGKSTFGRLFPLLRQSSERRKRSPILWFGDLVDFGSLSQAITRGERDLTLTFCVKLGDREAERRRTSLSENSFIRFHAASTSNIISLTEAEVEITLSLDEDGEVAFASRLQITLHNCKVDLQFQQDGNISKFTVDGEEFRASTELHKVIALQGSIMPRLHFFRADPERKDYLVGSRNPWRAALIRTVATQLRSNTSPQTILGLVSQLPLAPRAVLATAMKKIDGPLAWKALQPALHENHKLVRDIHRCLIAANIEVVIELLDEGLREIFEGVLYLKPLRASAERYYRRLDLAVSEIDPEGRNFPMFLDSLSPFELKRFQAWIKEHLDLEIAPRKEGAQLMVMAKGARDADMSNVADMGFGLSQVLPIAAQLWIAGKSRSSGNTPASFVVIEQPELHLHPEYQARLGDVFAGFARPNAQELTGPKSNPGSKTSRPRLIVETHSQYLVNRLGALIEQGLLRQEDISILLFEQDSQRPGTAKVNISEFDAGGVLTNWPFGFFDPDL